MIGPSVTNFITASGGTGGNGGNGLNAGIGGRGGNGGNGGFCMLIGVANQTTISSNIPPTGTTAPSVSPGTAGGPGGAGGAAVITI
jgi:hypothetical protein